MSPKGALMHASRSQSPPITRPSRLHFELIALALVVVGFFGIVPAGAQCVPPPTDLIHWWPGDGNASDIVGGYDGISGATFAPGEVDQAFSVDGSAGSYVDIPQLSPLTTATLDAWLNPSLLTGGYADSN